MEDANTSLCNAKVSSTGLWSCAACMHLHIGPSFKRRPLLLSSSEVSATSKTYTISTIFLDWTDTPRIGCFTCFWDDLVN